jgi:hypothetical protein
VVPDRTTTVASVVFDVRHCLAEGEPVTMTPASVEFSEGRAYRGRARVWHACDRAGARGSTGGGVKRRRRGRALEGVQAAQCPTTRERGKATQAMRGTQI